MSRDTPKLVIAVLAMLVALTAWLQDRPVPHLPGVLAPDDPQQEPAGDGSGWSYAGFELQPRAHFSVHARVLSATRYRWDRGASLAPIDFALGWGTMSDSSTLEHFRITQGARFYTLYPRDAEVDLAEALRHSGNMHLIPATDAVRRALFTAKEGSFVTLRGRLVDATRPDGFTWRTSLSRDDTGAGACELFWVEEAAVR